MPDLRGRKIARFDRVPDRCIHGDVDQGLAVAKASYWKGPETLGALQAFACISCGFHETYVADTSFFTEEPDRYTLLESEDPSVGPYR